MDALLADVWWRLRLNFYLVLPSEVALPAGAPMPTLIVDAVPMFFALMAVEAVAARFLLPPSLRYRLPDFLSSWTLGALQQVFELLCDLAGLKLVVAAFAFVYDHCRLADLDVAAHPAAVFLALLLGVDFCYYWFHRTVHEYHVLWALGHSVHHTGEDFNMSAALRQGMLQSLTAWPFFLPLALVFPPQVFAAHFQLNALYQIWPHTELVGRLGPLEYLLSTPSSHRMHHRPPGNCNYGGVFIVWDKLFGTFRPETERVDWYGLAGQPQTYDLVTINTHHFQKMWADLKGTAWGKLTARRVPAQWVFAPSALFRPLPPLKGAAPHRPRRTKYAPPEGLGPAARALGSAVAIGTGYAALLLSAAKLLAPAPTAALGLASAALLVAVGRVLDGKAVPASWAAGGAVGAGAALALTTLPGLGHR